MKRLLLVIFIVFFFPFLFCSKEEDIGLVTMVWSYGLDNPFAALFFGYGGKKVIWGFEVINCSDSVARNISLYLNREKVPFYSIDSILPHQIKKITRWQYKPKIVLSDTIIYEGHLGHKKFKDKFIPASGIPLKKDFIKKEER